MEPEQAWQSALGQLQLEMPKATFDTWVRDTRVVSYEDGRFVIGARNLYTRDWLEGRLSSTANRLLMGIMNRSVEVEFVVAESGSNESENFEPEADDQAGSEESILEEDSGPTGDDKVFIEAHYDLAYDEIVKPKHITATSRYFLHHLQVIGPDLGWLYLGFRQAAYNSGARKGNKWERFPGKVIASLSGITERTFWNLIRKAETWERLKGLVKTTEASPEWDASSSTPRRLSRLYIVSMDLPLTAADACSLRTWLKDNLERVSGPEGVLTAAAETPLDELLPQGAQAQAGDSPESVPSIVRSLFADALPAKRVEVLSTNLQKHIMPDDTDQLTVTHFFIENILPHLGAGPGWLLTLLRGRCYYNPETRETRNKVTVWGGYDEIAAWLGLTGGRRARTVWDWLYGKHSESRGRSKQCQGDKGEQRGPGRQASEIGKLSNPVLRVYLREVTEGKKVSSFATSPRTFEVLRQEIPSEILEAVLDEQAGGPGFQTLRRALAGEKGDLDAVCSIVEPDPDAVCSIVEHNLDAVCSIGLTRFAEYNDAVCSIGLTRFADHLDAVCRVFKLLNYLNPSTNDSHPSLSPLTDAGTTPQSGRGAGNLSIWDFNFLMKNNSVLKVKELRALQKTHVTSFEELAVGFVSWLLYAYSPARSRVTNPISLAVRRILENVHAGAGGDFDRLAHLRPFVLKAIFDNDLAGELWQVTDSMEKEIYVSNFAQLSAPMKRELYRRLFGSSE